MSTAQIVNRVPLTISGRTFPVMFGVPEMMPFSESSDRPLGSAPEQMMYVYEPDPPLAVTDCL